MEAGYGGPVWHASVAWHQPRGLRPTVLLSRYQKRLMWAVALEALEGVGAAVLGEWRQRLDFSLHLKRRLAPAEWPDDRPWGMDYRGTPEGWSRLNAIALYLPVHLHEGLMAELHVKAQP